MGYETGNDLCCNFRNHNYMMLVTYFISWPTTREHVLNSFIPTWWVIKLIQQHTFDIWRNYFNSLTPGDAYVYDIELVLVWDQFPEPVCIIRCLIRDMVILFIRPFDYTSVWLYARLKNGRIMPWQCPSVHPSVRVFRTFLQHALRYQFETWYIHSVGGTTCQVWVA